MGDCSDAMIPQATRAHTCALVPWSAIESSATQAASPATTPAAIIIIWTTDPTTRRRSPGSFHSQRLKPVTQAVRQTTTHRLWLSPPPSSLWSYSSSAFPVPSSSPSWSPLFLMSKSVSGSVRARVGRRNSYSSCRPSSTSQDSRLDYWWQERGDEDEEAVFTDSSVYRQRDFRLPVPWFGFRCLCIDKLTSSSRQPTLGNSSTPAPL